jgi:hypothetical protein
MTASDTAEAFDIGRIDEVIHGRLRLGVRRPTAICRSI